MVSDHRAHRGRSRVQENSPAAVALPVRRLVSEAEDRQHAPVRRPQVVRYPQMPAGAPLHISSSLVLVFIWIWHDARDLVEQAMFL